MGGRRTETSWRTSNQLRTLSASGSAASAPVRTCELRPRMGELIPGLIVEQVAGREDGVEVHDMDVAAGDHLELRLVSHGAGHGRTDASVATACPSATRAATPLTSCASGSRTSQRSMTANVSAAIVRRVGSSTRCPPASRTAWAATQDPTANSVSPGPTGERSGQERRRFPEVAGNDVDQRLCPCRVGVMVGAEPSALARSRSSRACGP